MEIRERDKKRRKKSPEKSGKLKEISRLEEWLKSYGITNQTKEVKGAEKHIQRLRQGNTEIEKNGFKFTFKKDTDRVQYQAEDLIKMAEEKRRAREKV